MRNWNPAASKQYGLTNALKERKLPQAEANNLVVLSQNRNVRKATQMASFYSRLEIGHMLSIVY